MITFAVLLATAASWAATPQEILAEVRDANQVSSSIQTVEMTIVSKSGSERSRTMEMKTKRGADARMTLARVTAPSDEAGTQLLLVDHPGQVDEQLFYLPSTKQTMRVSGKARKGAFLGSDFAYEDFELDPDTGTHTLVEETDASWVIDTDPGDDSQYGRLRTTVDRTKKVATKVEFFDEEGVALKVLDVKETVSEGGKTFARLSEMTNLKKGGKTVMKVLEQKVDVGDEALPDETFSKAYMERG